MKDAGDANGKDENERSANDIDAGMPEKEPETIGEALQKYYEEQLTHQRAPGAHSGSRAMLEAIMSQHSLQFN